MTILSRYVLRSFLLSWGVSLASFCSIYLIIDFLEKIARFSRGGGSGNLIAGYFLLQGVEVFCQMLPLSLLTASLLTIGTLSRTGELTAISTAGVSITRLSIPLLVCGLAATMLLFALGETTLPSVREKRNEIKVLLTGKKPQRVGFTRNDVWYREPDGILAANRFIPESRRLVGITILSLDAEFRPVQRIDAHQGELGTGRLLLSDVTLRRFQEGRLISFERSRSLEVPTSMGMEDLRVIEKNAENMSVTQLAQYRSKLRASGHVSPRWETLFHSRIAEPFSALVMTLIGIPFAVRHGRHGGPARGIALTILTGFTFFILNGGVISLGQAGYLPPLIAGWIVPLSFLVTGGYLLRRVEKG